jgi:hypothetical protein
MEEIAKITKVVKDTPFYAFLLWPLVARALFILCA